MALLLTITFLAPLLFATVLALFQPIRRHTADRDA